MLTNRIRVFRNCSYYTGKCMFELSYLLMTSSQHRGALTLKANRPSSVVLFQFYCEKSSPSLSSLYPWWVMASVRQVVVVVEVQKKHQVVSVKTEITIFCTKILQRHFTSRMTFEESSCLYPTHNSNTLCNVKMPSLFLEILTCIPGAVYSSHKYRTGEDD